MNCPTLLLFALVSTAAAQGASVPVAASLQPLIDRQIIPGAVTLVATRDRVLDVGAAGFADLKSRRPMTAGSMFWIASMTKPITATAVMMLVDEGRISLDDPVSQYLPNFALQLVVTEATPERMVLRRPTHPLTIRNVLSHTGGLTAITPLERGHVDLLSLAENVTSYSMLPLRFEPGTRFEYSNAGINTAARIVEVVSGMPFAQFLQTRLLSPLDMKDTTFWPDAGQLGRLVTSYRPADEGSGLVPIPITTLSYPLDNVRRGICAAGGLFSTAHDLGQFCRMILSRGVLNGRRYLSEKSLVEMTRVQTDDLPTFKGRRDVGYGLGWGPIFRETKGFDAAGAIQHGGSYNTLMRIDPSRNLIYVLLVSDSRFRSDNQAKLWSTFFGAAVTFAAQSRR